MRRRRSLGALTTAMGLVLVACGGPGPAGTGSDPSPGARTAAERPAPLRYVALGDSYTAAPLVPSIDGAAGPCLRSTGSYPALVAASLEAAGRSVRLADRSCVEARTGDLFAPQTVRGVRVPPQTRPLDRRTDLVTVGIGGNDALTSLIGTCPALRSSDPAGSSCADAVRDGPDDPLDRLVDVRTELADALRRVVRLAPRAQVLVVGYPQTAPAAGACPGRLPLADGDVAYARQVADGLDDALRSAADDAGAGFVDAYAGSAGHDICSPDPWVNGSGTDRGAALAYHPFAAGQEALADLVLAALRG